MRIAVPLERQAGEARVALVPESVKKLVASGVEVTVEAGAGAKAGFLDQDYEAAGAGLTDHASLLREGDVLTCVNRPEPDDFQRLKAGTVVIGFLKPLDEPAALEPVVSKRLTEALG